MVRPSRHPITPCPRKTLFIDFDGVLHDLTATENHHLLFQWAPCLTGILAEHDVSLVIHSIWRTHCSENKLRAFLPVALARRVTGVVRPGSKYFAIMEYAQTYGIEGYRVLDDAWHDFKIGWEHLIVCDPEVQRKLREFFES